MKNQTIEQAVEEMPTNKCPVCDGDGCTVEHDPNDPTGQTPIQVQCDFCHAEGKITTLDCVREALQAQRDAGAREERVNIIEIVRFTKFRDNQPQESYHKYLQQTKGVNYIRNKILQALTPPTK